MRFPLSLLQSVWFCKRIVCTYIIIYNNVSWCLSGFCIRMSPGCRDWRMSYRRGYKWHVGRERNNTTSWQSWRKRWFKNIKYKILNNCCCERSIGNLLGKFSCLIVYPLIWILIFFQMELDSYRYPDPHFNVCGFKTLLEDLCCIRSLLGWLTIGIKFTEYLQTRQVISYKIKM